MQNYLVSTLTVAATFGLYQLFSKYIPVSKSKHVSNKTFAQLRSAYLGFDLRLIGLSLILTILFTYLLYQLLSLISDFRLSTIEDAKILIKPDTSILLLPAMFNGMLAAALTATSIGKHQLKEKWSEFMAYYNLKYKFNYERAMVYVLRLISILVIPLTILSLDFYTSFGEKHVKFNRLLGFGTKTYLYTEVSALTRVLKVKAPNGNILAEPHTVIRFKDGAEWSTRSDGSDDQNKNREIINLVLSKTDKQIAEKEFAD